LSTIGGYAPGNLIGPAYGATYILAKTENTEWERHIEEDAWVAGAEWVDSIGADIISSSLGYSIGFTNGEPDYAWSDLDGNTTIVTIGADIAASRGILVVNSAGNDGWVALPANTLIGPCDGDSVLAVGAVDGAGVRGSFSSVGLTADGRIKPDVMAMGVGVRVAGTTTPTVYGSSGGTSFSCPLAAGAAALILEARPNASNQAIMDALRSTASQAGAPDRFYGWGIVDAAAAASVLPTAVRGTPSPAAIVLHPAYPNPFNPTTTIEYEIASRAHVRLTVFDVTGARVATLVDETQLPGRKSVAWNARGDRGERLASGVYLYRLYAGGATRTRKMVLLK
jgi:subtilisin family serine protease